MIYFEYLNNGRSDHVIYNRETGRAKVTETFKDDLVYKGNKVLFMT
ncbi:MAG: hypothetical protein LBD80_01925 [Tannerella sp.]|jgi:hypothetical protein|nr:hypothetical protein [Tannerella sp.]